MVVQRTKMFEAGMTATIELNGMADAYPTRIEDVKEGVLVIATPLKQREYVSLEAGKRVMLSVVRRNSPYFFETAVIGPEWHDGQQFTLIKRPPDGAGVALRGSVRVPVTIADAQFWIEGENGKFGPTVTGSVLDISAGGLLVMTKEGLPEGGLVLTRFNLSRLEGALMASIRILKDFERTSDVGVKSHRGGCQFVDLPEKEKERLVKFVFNRERELRQKGVI